LLFYAYTTVVILLHVLKDREVTADTLCGAVCVYLLMGMTWMMAYVLLEGTQPGSFASPETALNWSDLLYYSFATLTTVGYGDVAPLTSKARSLSFLEAVFGVLYVAVLISRLVGAYLARSLRSQSR
jgi:hypothetical protein